MNRCLAMGLCSVISPQLCASFYHRKCLKEAVDEIMLENNACEGFCYIYDIFMTYYCGICVAQYFALCATDGKKKSGGSS